MSTAITRQPLGGTTTNRKWFLDVDTSTTGTPEWVGVFGMQEFKPSVDTSTGDTSDGSSHWKGAQNTAQAWKNEGKLKRASKASAATAYDPGQEVLRAAAIKVGVEARVHVRWYEMEPGGPRVEAYEGYGTVTWSEEGGAMDALSIVSFTINGDGARTDITHPDTDTAAVAVIAAISPSGQAAGEVVKISGSGFTGATAVTFDTAEASFTVASGTEIYASIPATITGATAVTVTTAAGTSEDAAYVAG